MVEDKDVRFVAFTGHRHVKCVEMLEALEEVARRFPNADWICGGAVGVDSNAAEYAMMHGIKLHLILPFPPEIMWKYWTPDQRAILKNTIDYAEKLSVLNPYYDVRYYQLRNMRMVDSAQVLIAFYDGSPGGTANCVRYACSLKNYPIVSYSGPFNGSHKSFSC